LVSARLKRTRQAIKHMFYDHWEHILWVMIIVLGALLCLLQLFGIFRFNLGSNACAVLGTTVQSLASLFAIVFSVSLVAVQLCAENLSHRLIRLYVWNWNFVVQFGLSAFSLLFNLVLLSNESFFSFAVYGVFWSIVAALGLIPFLIFTIRFLIVRNVVKMLLRRIKTNPQLLSENFAEDKPYLDYLQPVEDVISSCVRKGDYATAKDLINLIAWKMFSVLATIKKKIRVADKATCDKLLFYMSAPFARLLGGVAVSANKNDAMEITIYIIGKIASFVEEFNDARFVPAFKVFDGVIERIRSQAKHRFTGAEYAVDFAWLEVAISRARVIFSQSVP
jgi:hypothetical protein